MEKDSPYVVFKHKFSNLMKIHRADCLYAKNPGTKTFSTEWHGYFDSLEDAEYFCRRHARMGGWSSCEDCTE